MYFRKWFLVASALVLAANVRAELDERIIEMVQIRAENAVCGDEEFLSKIDASNLECVAASRSTMRDCWSIIQPYLPDLALGEGGFSDEENKQKIVGLPLVLAKCIQASILVPSFSLDSSGATSEDRDIEAAPSARERATSLSDSFITTEVHSWPDIVETVRSDYLARQNEFVKIEEMFSKSEYDYIVNGPGNSLFAARADEEEVVPMEDSDAISWGDYLDSVDLGVLEKVAGGMHFSKRAPIITADHAFVVQYSRDNSEKLDRCVSTMQAFECGSCDVKIDKARSIQVLWMSSRVFSYFVESVEASSDDSEIGRVEATNELLMCWTKGMVDMGYDESVTEFPKAKILRN